MMVWDLAGSDQFADVTKSYLRGSDGFLYVADGTRKETVEAAIHEYQQIIPDYPHTSAKLLINKCDLQDNWEVSDDDLKFFNDNGIETLFTSAKDGLNVEKAFHSLASSMCE